MVVGASGGPRIITAVIQTLLRVLSYGQDPLTAVEAPRLHHQLLPDLAYAERQLLLDGTTKVRPTAHTRPRGELTRRAPRARSRCRRT